MGLRQRCHAEANITKHGIHPLPPLEAPPPPLCTPEHQRTSSASHMEAGAPEASTKEPSDVRRHPEPGPPTPAVPLVGDSRGLTPVPPTESWTTGG